MWNTLGLQAMDYGTVNETRLTKSMTSVFTEPDRADLDVMKHLPMDEMNQLMKHITDRCVADNFEIWGMEVAIHSGRFD